LSVSACSHRSSALRSRPIVQRYYPNAATAMLTFESPTFRRSAPRA
jgi:hypothetical protein